MNYVCAELAVIAVLFIILLAVCICRTVSAEARDEELAEGYFQKLKAEEGSPEC